MIIKLPKPNAQLSVERKRYAESFYRSFTEASGRKKLLFGFNRYAPKVIESFPIDGIIDDFTSESSISGMPVFRTAEIPDDALVLALSGGRPLTVNKMLNELNVEHLDYFAFQKVAQPELPALHFNEGFHEDFQNNSKRYEEVVERLADEESAQIFSKLVNFRLTHDITFLEGFSDREKEQYFEPFLKLKSAGESFADIGGFDGYTSEEFSRLCPDFSHISLFEPDPTNMANSKKRLAALDNVTYHECGLGDQPGSFKLSSNGSGSSLSDSGEIEVDVITLDSLKKPYTFIKIDIEGAELSALRGARETILSCHPKIAVAIYHCEEGTGPFWQIPELILSTRSDYKIYVRHYTESIYETVMFFVPTEQSKSNEH